VNARGALATTILAFAVCGCHFTTPPDPNDPKNIPQPKVAQRLHEEIQATADDLNTRVIAGQIPDSQRKTLLGQRAEQLLAEGDPAHSAPQDAWIYADLYLTDQNYSEAIPLLRKAIEYAKSVKNDDRRVNDSFRLAEALAQTGKVGAALDLAQQVIASKPLDPGPVLPSVLLQLTPVCEGKGKDPQLAKLLEEAIHEHLRMHVDPNSDAGKAFLTAKPYHIRHAWDKIIELLRNSGNSTGAAQAEDRKWKMLQSLQTPTTNV
jgi:tetratricopeptide (TPR) repeat protein